MWDFVVFRLDFAVLFIFGAWISYKRGEFTEFIDYTKIAHRSTMTSLMAKQKPSLCQPTGLNARLASKPKKM